MEIHQQILMLGYCYILLFMLDLWIWKLKSDPVMARMLNGSRFICHLRHLAGVLIMILLPTILLPALPTHLLEWPRRLNKFQLSVFMLVTFPVSLIAVKHGHKHITQIPGLSRSSIQDTVIHVILRTAFLASYEWFFRGCILHICVTRFGGATAVCINLALYAMIHCFSGKREIWGSIPFGLALCLFTLWFQSVWPAILLHLLLSFSYERIFLYPIFKKSKIVL